MTREQIITIVLAASLFALLCALWFGAVLLWSLRRTSVEQALERRLTDAADDRGGARVLRLWHEGEVATTVVRGGGKPPMRVRFQRACRDAGFTADPGTIVAGVLAASAGLGLAVGILLRHPVFGVLVAVSIPVLFRMYMGMRISSRAVLFEQQFIGALELAARSLRAGHPLLGAFQLVSEELDPPVSTVFAEICQQHDMGVSLEASIQRVAAGSRNSELKLFATSVAVQLRSGGNLAEMMDRLAFVIRDRARLHRRVRVLTAQTQLSKRILIALPFLIFALLNFINPRYMDPFFNSDQGMYMLLIGGGMLLLGIVMMNRLAILRY